jgi:hypothetical protein
MNDSMKAGKAMDVAWSSSFSHTFKIQMCIALAGIFVAFLLKKKSPVAASDSNPQKSEAEATIHISH